MELIRGAFCISDDVARLQINVIHRFLSEESYWARGIPRELVERSLHYSMCFGIYAGSGEQVGFARLVTDRTTFAYLADVFVLPALRGQGLSKALMRFIVEHPELQGLRRWVLGTRDAHGLYAQFGFKPLDRPEIFMQIHNPSMYATPEQPQRP
jgi:GNAT superfamily N-acetyltransferase